MYKNIKQKQSEAQERQEKHNNLSIKEKIDKLDKRLGAGIGAKKEREKLSKKLEEKNV